MIKTFTPELDLTTSATKNEELPQMPAASEPSLHVLQNILNYSRNLEVRSSKGLGHVAYLRS